MHTTTLLLLALKFLSVAVPVLLSAGLALWWWRTKHWSFAVLASGILFYLVSQFVVAAEQEKLFPVGAAARQVAPAAVDQYMNRRMGFQLVTLVLLGIGGAGFVGAVRSRA